MSLLQDNTRKMNLARGRITGAAFNINLCSYDINTALVMTNAEKRYVQERIAAIQQMARELSRFIQEKQEAKQVKGAPCQV